MALITLTIGILIGFPPTALAVLVGFSAATGPAFADMGYDLKTGYLLRGEGRDMEAELAGRKQQFLAAMIGFAVAAVVVLVFHGTFFSQNLIPPVDRVYAASIKAGSSAEIATQPRDLGDSRRAAAADRRLEAPARHPAVDRHADRLAAGRLGRAGRPADPLCAAAPARRQACGRDERLRRRRDRGRRAVQLLPVRSPSCASNTYPAFPET
ncbi:OPT/YSL family transporter [Cupriavidus basilensis]